MPQEGTNLSQDVKGSSSSGARSLGTIGFISSFNSAKLTTENITTGFKPASPAINLPQDQRSHDGTNVPCKAMPTMVGRNANPSNPLWPFSVRTTMVARNDDLTKSEGGDYAIGERDDVAGSNSKSIRSLLDEAAQDVVKDAATPTINGGNSSSRISGGKGKGIAKESEEHIWTERERRKKMKNMYNTLHSFLPRLIDSS